MGRITRNSFTLIELIIAVGIIGFILPAVFAIFFAIIRQQLVLVAYKSVKQEGDSAQRNIKTLLQKRAAYITDSTYDYATFADVCPLITLPTPAFAPGIYFKDTDEKKVHLYASGTAIASDAADIITKTYSLTSADVQIATVGFSCSRVNDFTPPVVSVSYTVLKSMDQTQDISLPYSFKVRLRNY